MLNRMKKEISMLAFISMMEFGFCRCLERRRRVITGIWSMLMKYFRYKIIIRWQMSSFRIHLELVVLSMIIHYI